MYGYYWYILAKKKEKDKIKKGHLPLTRSLED
jgi:hypothetical protein